MAKEKLVGVTITYVLTSSITDTSHHQVTSIQLTALTILKWREETFLAGLFSC